MANQSATLDWWETQRANYNIFVSELVVSEASKGHPEASLRRLAVINDLPLILISEEVRGLAHALIVNHALPQKAEADASDIAGLEKQFTELPAESRRLTGPLFWLHGDESKERLEMYVGKMAEGGNGTFTAESRPHKDWLEEGWFRDLIFL